MDSTTHPHLIHISDTQARSIIRRMAQLGQRTTTWAVLNTWSTATPPSFVTLHVDGSAWLNGLKTTQADANEALGRGVVIPLEDWKA